MRSFAIGALCLVIGLLLFGQSPAWGAINPVLSYQGSLKDSTGAAYPDGSYTLTFTIYDDSTFGAALWTETQVVTLKDGLMHAYLGSVVPFAADLYTHAPLWLGVQLASEPEFAPRHLIGSAVYSFMAANALALEGFPAAHFADSGVVNNAVAAHATDPQAHRPLNLDASEIVSGVIASERLPAVVVDSSQIADGGVGTADLADGSVTSEKIATAAVGTQQIADSSITSPKLPYGVIGSHHFETGAVNSAAVEDGSLKAIDLEDSTITGQKIAAGSIAAQHLSSAAFTGANIEDGTLTGVELADSTITGDKIAAGSIESVHLSGVAITSAMIVDETITGADIKNGTIGVNDIGPGQISGYHIADGSVAGTDIAANAINGGHVVDESLTGADLASNSIVERHIVNNTIDASKTKDEPGVVYTTAGTLTSVGTTVVTWMTATIDAPAPGILLVLMNGTANLGGNEIAQMSIATTASGFGRYGEARISSPTASVGANMVISISDVIPVAAAGSITVYGNVRSPALSAGPVDFTQGALQVIYLRTEY